MVLPARADAVGRIAFVGLQQRGGPHASGSRDAIDPVGFRPMTRETTQSSGCFKVFESFARCEAIPFGNSYNLIVDIQTKRQILS